MDDPIARDLRALYQRHLPDLLTLLERHKETSYPHLINASPAYGAARRRLVFVGQQTFGWEPDSAPAQAMERDLKANLIEGMLKLYTDFFPTDRRSPFWRAVRQLQSSVTPDAPADACVWANLVKVDQERQRPPAAVDRDWFDRFNVLAAEMRALQPDVVIFFTGPAYDERLVESFPGARIIPIPESDGYIDRIEHRDLPYHSYRTYHPAYLSRTRWQVLDQLAALCHDGTGTQAPGETALLVQSRAKDALAAALRDHVGAGAMDPSRAGYAARVQDNVLPGIQADAYEPDFSSAAGHELDEKMRAAYSSSALAVNTFARWKSDVGQLTLGGRPGFSRIQFEGVCPTGLRGTPPHLDLLAEGADGLVGVEVKCTEHLQAHPLDLDPVYDPLLAKYPALSRVKSEWGFTYLNASQLVKHTLGLLRAAEGRPVTLLYLFWEPTNWHEYPLFDEHRREVRRFATFMAGSPIRFAAMTFDQLLTAWALAPGPDWLASHLQALQDRYSVAI